MRAYKILLGECTMARELAVVVGKMLADEHCRNVDKHTVVKAAFIKSLLPFAKRLVSGGTIAVSYTHLADADRIQATEHDPRKTRWGNIMRKTNIDELPQFCLLYTSVV